MPASRGQVSPHDGRTTASRVAAFWYAGKAVLGMPLAASSDTAATSANFGGEPGAGVATARGCPLSGPNWLLTAVPPDSCARAATARLCGDAGGDPPATAAQQMAAAPATI